VQIRAVAVVVVLAWAQIADPRPRANPAALRAEGLSLGYDLDHAEAMDTFDRAIALAPDDPAGHRLAAALIWIRVLFAQGAITVDDYLGSVRSDAARTPPPAALDREFHNRLRRAIDLSEARLRAHPDDADAHFQAGAAYGYQATYTATVEGRVLASFGAARRAYREHQRAMAIDPRRTDAGLTVGLYRYAIAELSAPARLMARLAGISGSKASGLALVEAAAATPSDVQSNARFTLILLYNRERRYDDALRTIADLQRRYPRNRLLWLEAGMTALRAGRAADACAAIESGLAQLAADPRPRASGEDARWHFAHGAALVALHDIARAAPDLEAALAGATRDWVRGRVKKELGKIADLQNDRPRALAAYRDAERLCRADHDDECVADARALLKRPFR
jgi:tetratricopeptide (TPR) repeat protein